MSSPDHGAAGKLEPVVAGIEGGLHAHEGVRVPRAPRAARHDSLLPPAFARGPWLLARYVDTRRARRSSGPPCASSARTAFLCGASFTVQHRAGGRALEGRRPCGAGRVADRGIRSVAPGIAAPPEGAVRPRSRGGASAPHVRRARVRARLRLHAHEGGESLVRRGRRGMTACCRPPSREGCGSSARCDSARRARRASGPLRAVTTHEGVRVPRAPRAARHDSLLPPAFARGPWLLARYVDSHRGRVAAHRFR